ncbi:hypothetical protein BZA70DRAFT_270788 [Myxozyma melibiosi]|uniref:Ubiquitin carboxyl-terminal hydrolase n=1 Tax=Myxozyma melibiosi TaxID=54550 RepID=A0ABR1FBK1_9ASCO
MSCAHLDGLTLRPPTASQQVYKDDCTQCFDNTESPLGLDVCLSCFNGGCTSEFPGHSKLHYSITEHPIVLNIKKTRKQIKRDEAPPKIAKLAIPAETEEDRFDTATTVKCLACNVELDKESGKLSDVVNGVMTSLSSNKQSEVKAWEEEISPCEHTLLLAQDEAKVLADQELAHCSQCELKENLWLCLQCGALGCGRQQFGGVGGNGHGLAHFDQTHHPVSVKLGSITPDGTADVYCYLCNEERQDPNLAEHLWHWGIKISERQKVEKSLVELQLEQNLKWEFSMTSDNGEELKPLFGPGFTGLKNLGNSCYLASVVQCLFSLPSFQQRYYKSDCEMPRLAQPAADFETQLRKIAYGLLSGRYSVPSTEDNFQAGIAPATFKAMVGKNHAEFSTMRQQDAFEFLQYLVEMIDRANHKDVANDPAKTFDFVIEQRLECLGCHRVNYKSEKQNNISVPVPIRRLGKASPEDKDTFESVSLTECLDIYTAPETLEYTCQDCGSKDGAIKRSAFKTFPDVLIVNARRFEIINWVPTKLDVPVVVPDEPFDLDQYISLGLQEGEELLVESDSKAEAKFIPNEGCMSMLEGMGFPATRCEKALYNTGNADPDAAMNWLFAHMEDPDIDEPLKLESSGAGESAEISPEGVAMLTDMGFSVAQAKKALKETGGDMERAIEWVFSHPDDDGSDDAPASSSSAGAGDVTAGDSSLPATYKLHSIICHKGGSVHAGHYVAFIKKKVEEGGDGKWVLFNDEKVVEGGDVDEMKRFAYVYFFERQRS